MQICIPKETKIGERRVSLAPPEIENLARREHTIYVENSAGIESGYSDASYRDCGAHLVPLSQIFRENSLMVKVKELDLSEFPRVQKGMCVMLFAHFHGNPKQKQFFDSKKIEGISAIPFEELKIAGSSPILREMSICAGELAAHVACEYVRAEKKGVGVLPSDASAMIFGAGTAGWRAMEVLSKLVREIHLFDLRHKKYPRAHNVYIHESADNVIIPLLPHADMIICAALFPGLPAPKVVRKDYVPLMKKGAIIVDISIDEGGNCEFSRPTTFTEPVFTYEKKVQVYAVPNMPGSVPRSATPRLSRALLPFVERVAQMIDEGRMPASAEEIVKNMSVS